MEIETEVETENRSHLNHGGWWFGQFFEECPDIAVHLIDTSVRVDLQQRSQKGGLTVTYVHTYVYSVCFLSNIFTYMHIFTIK